MGLNVFIGSFGGAFNVPRRIVHKAMVLDWGNEMIWGSILRFSWCALPLDLIPTRLMQNLIYQILLSMLPVSP